MTTILSKNNMNELRKMKIESAVENRSIINKPIYPWIIVIYSVILKTK
jgi:hypothetical protein